MRTSKYVSSSGVTSGDETSVQLRAVQPAKTRFVAVAVSVRRRMRPA